MTFGERLAAIRKKNGLSMAEMASVLSVSVPGYKRLEDGTGAKTFEKLPVLAKTLCCRIDDLFPEMDAPEEEIKVSESKTVCADGFEEESLKGWES